MSPDSRSESYPTPHQVVEISAIQDRIIRNLRITDCYHRLSLAMTARTGACANWCTFATWASRQAGSTIRAEDFEDRLADHLRPGWTVLHPAQSLWRAWLRRGVFSPETPLGRLVRAVHSPFDAFERASEAVAVGNLKVFAEIGFVFARYLQSCPAEAPVESPEVASFLASLRAGPPPDGQDHLRRAFTYYHQQAFEPSFETRMQLILLANLEIGLHEQTRLQPEIQAALEVLPVTVEDLGARALQVISPGSRALGLFRRPLGFLMHRYGRFAREITRRAITDSLMVLALPDLVLQLGHNLERPFPDVLSNLTQSELRDLCRRYEPRTGVCDDCGAQDWADLHQRMHYIVHLFRAFHFHPALMNPPFTAAQLDRLMSGQIPDGHL